MKAVQHLINAENWEEMELGIDYPEQILTRAESEGKWDKYITPSAISKLFECLEKWGEDDELLKFVMDIFQKAVNPLVIDPLTKYLESDNPFTRTAAWKALAPYKEKAGPSVIECLSSNIPVVRGKALAFLKEIVEWCPIEPLLLRLKDRELWVREVAALVIHRWGEQRPKKLFEQLERVLWEDLHTAAIENVERGNSRLEYATRLMKSIIRYGALERELIKFTEGLKQDCKWLLSRYPENSKYTPLDYKYLRSRPEWNDHLLFEMLVQRSLYNIFHILRYLGKLNVSEWGEHLPEHFIDEVAPPCCWACTEYSPSQIPVEYLPAYLRSDDYLEFCHSVEIHLAPEAAPSMGPVDSETGKFKPEAGNFAMYGFCKRKKKLTWATDKYDSFTPRKLVSPIEAVSISIGELVWHDPWLWAHAKLDAPMRKQFYEWMKRVDHGEGEEPSDFEKFVYRMLKGAALSIETVESGQEFSFEHLIERDEGSNVFPIIDFPPFSWLIKLEHPPEGFGDRELCYRDLNSILNSATIYVRGPYHYKPP